MVPTSAKIGQVPLNDRGWLRPGEIAVYAGVCGRTVRSWIKQGLPHSRVRGVVLVRREALDAWLECHAVDTTQNALRIDQLVAETLAGLK